MSSNALMIDRPRAGGADAAIDSLADVLSDRLRLDEGRVREIAAEELERLYPPARYEIRLEGGRATKVVGSGVTPHKQFGEILGLAEEGHRNIFLVGPAGSCKSTMAEHLAEALDLPAGMLSLSQGVTESHLLGRTLPQADGSWQYQRSPFVRIFAEGGVFALDEIDAADSNVLVAVNAALANGRLALPSGEIVERSPRSFIVAIANTWGSGGDPLYVGRNQLDAATLDRFCLATVAVDYDVELERRIAEGICGAGLAKVLLHWIAGLRRAIAVGRLRRVASTRLVIAGARALAAMRSLDQIKARYFQSWSADELRKIEK